MPGVVGRVKWPPKFDARGGREGKMTPKFDARGGRKGKMTPQI